ncbi:MAG: hypothetical protein ABI651_15190 [Verrucomicrobiota bacterium]
MARPFPFDAKRGQKFEQSVTCSFVGDVAGALEATHQPTLTLGKNLDRKLPSIGLGMASYGQPFSRSPNASRLAIRRCDAGI